MMWQEEGRIMYEVFFVNFWVKFCVWSLYIKPENLKNLSKNQGFFSIPGLSSSPRAILNFVSHKDTQVNSYMQLQIR